MESISLRPPRCIALADPWTHGSHSTAHEGENFESNHFKSVQWSPDGTCLVANAGDQTLRAFVLPVDLLETPSEHELAPYAEFSAPEPIYTTAVYPFYELSDTSTTLVLYSVRDLPIHLSNPLWHNASVATYPLVSPTTEKYITPHSLQFCRSGTSFLTGSESLIAVFDLSRPGDEPTASFRTIPSKRKKIVGGGVGMKGIVSALSTSVEGILAAGTLTRSIGLYADEGQGDMISVFSVASEDEELRGTGVTQVAWSPCGRYLYVAERKSDGVLIYDVRVAGRRLGWLKGRRALTNQRMGIDIVSTATGNEVWAGGTDGVVRGWQNSWQREGVQEPFFEWAAHNDHVSSSVFHPPGTVAATSAGQRRIPFHSTQQSSLDNTLRVWSFD